MNGLDQVSPTTTDFSRRESEDESQRAEVSSESLSADTMLMTSSEEGHRTGQLNELTVRGRTRVSSSESVRLRLSVRSSIRPRD
jgi:hypothetical protein